MRLIRFRGFAAAIAVSLAMLALTAETRAGGWGDAFRISPPATMESGINESAAAADEAGNFLHAWTQIEPADVGIKLKLFSQVSHADGRNGPIQRVFDPPGDPWISQIALSKGPGGTGHLTWVEHEVICSPMCAGTDRVRYVTLAPDGSPTTAPLELATLPTGDGSYINGIAIDTDGSGRSRLAWFDHDASSGQGRVSMLIVAADGTPFAPSYLREADDWSTLAGIDLDSNTAGDTVVTWVGYPDGEATVEAVLTTGTGTVHPARKLHSPTSSADQAQAVIDETGRSTVTFLDQDANNRVMSRQLGANGTALGAGASVISDPDGVETGISDNAIAVAPDGRVTLTWVQRITPLGGKAVRTRTISPDGTVGQINEAVPSTASVDLDSATIASGAGGGVLAYQHTPFAGPESNLESIRAVELTPAGTATGETRTLDTVVGGTDTAWVENLVMSGKDAALSWRHGRSDVGFHGELYGAVLDATAPEVTLWSPAAATIEQEVLVGAQASDRSPVGFEWTIDSSFPAVTGAFARHTFFAPGDKTIRVVATDSAGNQTTKETSIEVKALPDPPDPPDPPAQPVPPNTTITAKPKKKVKAKAASFRFISSLTGSTFECRLDKAGWTDCKSPKKLKKLKPGKHTFRVRAIKGELIDKTPATYSWNIKKAVKPRKKRK